jgi:ribosomal protein S27E
MASDDAPKVISIKGRKPKTDKLKIEIVNRYAKKCQHRRVVINEDMRNVTCKKCGEAVDPVWLLLEWVKEDQRFKAETGARRSFLKELRQHGMTKARKEYTCCLCDSTIKNGHRYYRKSWNKTCRMCVEHREV